MNKNRVESFTDAIVAIIITIMVLEFKTPDSASLIEILNDLPYLFAYIVSFIYIGVAWYNHHYMFSLIKRVTKEVYWLNNFWLFSMSLIPVAAAWVGKYLMDFGPELFYLIIFVLWSVAYLLLSKGIIKQLSSESASNTLKVKNMFIYKFLNSFWFPLTTITMIIFIFVFPPSGLILSLVELIINVFNTNNDSDNFGKFIK